MGSMPSKLLAKPAWKNAVGASLKPKRLKLVSDKDGLYNCIVPNCDGYVFKSQRGCRKHIFFRHGWYFYFDEKPNLEEVLPERTIFTKSIQKTHKSNTRNIPMFLKSCSFAKLFKKWLMSPGGGLKGEVQADQICCRTLKYLKFCCSDASLDWEIPSTVVEYCIGSVTLMSDFIDFLKDTWYVGFSGII